MPYVLDASGDVVGAGVVDSRAVNIGAVRHSMGGQAIPRDGHAVIFDDPLVEPGERGFRAHAGARWRDVLRALDPVGLSPAVMQPNHDFAVASTFSVNAHRWPTAFGQMGATVQSVIRTGAPKDFVFLAATGGFWSSLCALSNAAGWHGGVDGPTKQMVFTIGGSFTAELVLNAAYEETLGRLVVALRGGTRAPLDDLSARQAADYARSLQQMPWYRWGFARDRGELAMANTGSLCDRERSIA